MAGAGGAVVHGIIVNLPFNLRYADFKQSTRIAKSNYMNIHNTPRCQLTIVNGRAYVKLGAHRAREQREGQDGKERALLSLRKAKYKKNENC